MDSLVKNINTFKPGVIFIQETKLLRKGQLKLPEYCIFEVIRANQQGGYLLTAVHQNLQPVLIFEDDNLEILVIQTVIGENDCRLINAYGPQETDNQEKIIEFYATLDQQVKSAMLEGCLVMIEMDANAKVGSNIIHDDPNASCHSSGRDSQQPINFTCSTTASLQ